MMGAARGDGDQGYNVGRNAALLAGHRPPRPGVHAEPLLRLVAADDPHGLPRDQGGRGRPVRRGRGRVGLPRGRRRAGAVPPEARRLRGSLYDVYIPMGRRRRTSRSAARSAARPRTSGRSTSQGRAVAAAASGHFDREIVPVDVPEARDDDGNVTAEARTVTKDDGPRAGHDDGGPGEPQARLPRGRTGHRRQLVPAQRRRRRRARDVRGQGGAPAASRRAPASSPRPSPRSGRRSWASARSRRSARCSSRPG